MPCLGELHKHQREIFLDSHRIRVLACGARWGKDRLTILDLIFKTLWLAQHEKERRRTLIPSVLAWYVAPTFGLLRQSWEELEYFTQAIPGAKLNQGSLRCWLPGGVEIEFKSADNPASLLARGLDYIAVTEAARVKREAWENSLMTRLSSPGRGIDGQGGIAILNSTPAGQNWFFDLWKQGQEPNDYIKSWRFSSYDNPYINIEELNRHREILPDRVFRQEYMAEFLAGSGSVFRDIRACLNAYDYPYYPRQSDLCPYSIGIDWGRHNDATAAIVLRNTDEGKYELANCLHLKNLSYQEQIDRIVELCEAYPAALVIPESNSLGDPLCEALRMRVSNSIRPFQTTASTKKAIIETLAYVIDEQALILPGISDSLGLTPAEAELFEELSSYEVYTSKSGAMTYSAPAGKHDDLVMALAFALSGKQSQSRLSVVRT